MLIIIYFFNHPGHRFLTLCLEIKVRTRNVFNMSCHIGHGKRGVSILMNHENHFNIIQAAKWAC
jgi:hypothetical protein